MGKKLNLSFYMRLKIVTNEHKHRHVCLSVRPSAWNNSIPTGQIFMKFGFWVSFEKLSRK